eukprot:15928418-Heterocapsa_arctica.AAC.1
MGCRGGEGDPERQGHWCGYEPRSLAAAMPRLMWLLGEPRVQHRQEFDLHRERDRGEVPAMSHTAWSTISSWDTSSGTMATLPEHCRRVPHAVPDAGVHVGKPAAHQAVLPLAAGWATCRWTWARRITMDDHLRGLSMN